MASPCCTKLGDLAQEVIYKALQYGPKDFRSLAETQEGSKKCYNVPWWKNTAGWFQHVHILGKIAWHLQEMWMTETAGFNPFWYFIAILGMMTHRDYIYIYYDYIVCRGWTHEAGDVGWQSNFKDNTSYQSWRKPRMWFDQQRWVYRKQLEMGRLWKRYDKKMVMMMTTTTTKHDIYIQTMTKYDSKWKTMTNHDKNTINMTNYDKTY